MSCHAATVDLLLAGAVGADSNSLPCGREAEPNDAPLTANPISAPLWLEGEIGAGDQDLLLLRTERAQLWQFRLAGVSGQQTRLDIHSILPNPDPTAPPIPGERLATRTAGSDAPQLLLGPGSWLLGLSVSGGAGTPCLPPRFPRRRGQRALRQR